MMLSMLFFFAAAVAWFAATLLQFSFGLCVLVGETKTMKDKLCPHLPIIILYSFAFFALYLSHFQLDYPLAAVYSRILYLVSLVWCSCDLSFSFTHSQFLALILSHSLFIYFFFAPTNFVYLLENCKWCRRGMEFHRSQVTVMLIETK